MAPRRRAWRAREARAPYPEAAAKDDQLFVFRRRYHRGFGRDGPALCWREPSRFAEWRRGPAVTAWVAPGRGSHFEGAEGLTTVGV